MAVIKLVPSHLTKSSTSGTISNPENAYTDTDSTTTAALSDIGGFVWLWGFNTYDLPDNAEITSIKACYRLYSPSSTNSSYHYAYIAGGHDISGGSQDYYSEKKTRAIVNYASRNIKQYFSGITLDRDTIRTLGDNLSFQFSISGPISYVYIYGAEIEIEYEIPKIYNKVEYGDKTLIDLTADTVTPSSLLQGYTAHDNTGAAITGTASPGGNPNGKVYQDGDGYVVLDDGEGTHREIDSLTVTENGTYNAPTGHAYDPVTVNVSGGGGSPANNSQIKFVDYDGTVLYSYTSTEWANVSALPSNPSHSGLISQGWNRTKTQIDSILNRMSDGDVWVGQMYEPASGKTEIDINADNPELLSPYLAIAVNGTAIIDWGDGTAADTITGTSYTTVTYIQHNYIAVGKYTISINGPIGFNGKKNYYSTLLLKSKASSNDLSYSQYIEAIRCASNASIEDYAFTHCYSLKSITIPEGVTSIGNYAFQNCNALQSITIPEGVTSIGNYAFQNCYSLKSIAIPEGVTSIGNNAFQSCHSLQSITIPDGVTSIGSFAFTYCYYLQSITIPDGVTSIGSNTFSGCHSLQSITIPEGVTSIGSNVFQNCKALQSITIPEGVTSIGNNAFQNCNALQSITIPDGVTIIGSYAFYGCSNVESIAIPEGITNIETYAFYDWHSLQSITIPDGVTSIGSYAFYGCNDIQSITIPEGVTSIGNDAFNGCHSLQSITIPDGVTRIGSSAFSNCYSLQSITIPDGITTIDGSVFSNCNSLQSITIPDGVTSIGNSAFGNCYSLQSITIPEGVTSIGNNAFQSCYSLNYIRILSITPPNLGTSAFTSYKKIYVPAESLETYKTATNWSTYASYMEGE